MEVLWQTGEQQFTTRQFPGGIRLKLGNEEILLRPVPAASGAKYQVPDDPATVFWEKGEQASLSIRGREYPLCRRLAVRAAPLVAGGHEPAWRLEIGEQLIFEADEGRTRLAIPAPAAQPGSAGRRYEAHVDGQKLQVAITDQVGTDTMTGMPHPHTVEVRLGEKQWKGCGGEPVSLLQGGEWRVTEIRKGKAVQKLIAQAPMTLSFNADGSAWGAASCNRFRGGFELGEGLRFLPLATTLMACEEPVSRQEQLFMGLLQQVRRFRILPDGALVLETDAGDAITARRAQEQKAF